MAQEQFSKLKPKLDTFKDRLTSRYEAQSARVTPPSEWNEKQTENVIIEPVLQALGYDPYDPNSPEVAFPEFKRGIKKSDFLADYVLFLNSQPVIVVECKRLHQSLDSEDARRQLDEYFRAPGSQVNTVKIAILTNGDDFEFYTDSKEKNVMDSDPYWTFKLSKFSDDDVKTLLMYSAKNLRGTLDDLPEIARDAHFEHYKKEGRVSLENCLNDISSYRLKLSEYEFEGCNSRKKTASWAAMFEDVITTLCEKYALPDHLDLEKFQKWFRPIEGMRPQEDSSKRWFKVGDYEIQIGPCDASTFIGRLKTCFKSVGISASQLVFYF